MKSNIKIEEVGDINSDYPYLEVFYTGDIAPFLEISINNRKLSFKIYNSEKDALGAAFDGGPVSLAYHKFSETIKQQVHEAYLASIADYKKENGYEVPGEFVVAKGIR